MFALFLYSSLDPCYWSPFLLFFAKMYGASFTGHYRRHHTIMETFGLTQYSCVMFLTQKYAKCFTSVCSFYSSISRPWRESVIQEFWLEHCNCPLYSEKMFHGLSFTWPTPPLNMNQANDSDSLLQDMFNFVNSWSWLYYEKLQKYFSSYDIPEHR